MMVSKRSLALIIVCLIVIVGVASYVFFFQPAKEAPKQELVIGTPFDIKGLDPMLGRSGPELAPLYLGYETLVYFDAEWKLQGRLAHSWNVSDDVKTWTLHLRKGVKFSDGTPFNATAVKFTFERYINISSPTYLQIKSMEILDDYTLRFVLKGPNALFLYDFHSTMILSPTAVNEAGEFVEPIGTGPFKIEEWIKGEKLVYVRNEEYWGSEPSLEKVTLRVIPDHQTRSMALEAGEIDVSFYLPVQAIPGLRESPSFVLYEEASTCPNWIGLNTQKEPFNDIRVRKAVNYAIDVEGIINSVIGELAQPATKGPLSTPCYTDIVDLNLTWYGYSPEEAEQLLAEAGWEDADGDGILDKDGSPLKFTLISSLLYTEGSAIAEAVQAQLREVGIDVEIQVLESGARFAALRNQEYEMVELGGICPHNEPTPWFTYYFHSQKQPLYCVYKNGTLDNLIDQLYTTIDPEDRLNVFLEIQEIIEENAPGVFLYSQNQVFAMNKRVKGFGEPEPGMTGSYSYTRTVYIEE